MNPTAIVITGPTASGKSALAAQLASRLNTEVISADSRQIYRGIPICTAVPTTEERLGIPHHLLEAIPLSAYYSASTFEEKALSLSAEIIEAKGTVVVCGGSMMYVDALCYGLDELPTVPENIRDSLMEEWREKGDVWLLGQLKRLDPEYGQKADLKNLKRVFHAVELSLTAGKPYSTLLTGTKRKRDFNILKITLQGSRELLFSKINNRVENMIDSGLEEEARSVSNLRHLNSLNTVGMKEMFRYIDGELTLPEAIAKIQKNTRVYAKKQLTWHKRDKNAICLDFGENAESNCRRIMAML